jgi:hypothetical protein
MNLFHPLDIMPHASSAALQCKLHQLSPRAAPLARLTPVSNVMYIESTFELGADIDSPHLDTLLLPSGA